MASITETLRESYQESIGRRFNWEYFLQDNVTGSWMQTIWVVVLFLVTLALTGRQWVTFPTQTTVIVLVWLAGIALAILDGLHVFHSGIGSWLRTNLLGSVSNALLTLFLALVIFAITYGIWQWAVVNATFSPALTEPQYRNPDGATWGVIPGAWDLLMYGRFPRNQLSRVWV
ncbi:MAG: hypothetical protein ACK2UT_11505, partial [Candidatus Promineifilaceae bacterium]